MSEQLRMSDVVLKMEHIVKEFPGVRALDDVNFERTPYTEFGAYGRSKTANILFAVVLDKRWKERGVRACAAARRFSCE